MALPVVRMAFPVALAALPTPAGAGDEVGIVTKVQPESYQAEASVGYRLIATDPILMNARVYTKRYGTVQILLDDGSDLLITENSSIKIDEFVYAGDGAEGDLTITLVKGGLRAISGRMADSSYDAITPTATLGIRGTQYWLETEESGLLRIWTDEGAITVRPLIGDRTYVFNAPDYAECTVTACEVTEAPAKPEAFARDPRAK